MKNQKENKCPECQFEKGEHSFECPQYKEELMKPIKKVAIDYKGKHFIICDEDKVDVMDSVIPYIDLEKVNLQEYVADCIYYGVPLYFGKDEEFRNKLNKIAEEINEDE